MGILQNNPEGPERLPGEMQALYPVPPLSWLAPLWSYACGFMASSAAAARVTSGITGSAGQATARPAGYNGIASLFMLGLLLAGPLLGVAWGASGQIRRYRGLAMDTPADAPPEPRRSLPYTLPGSPSHALSTWLSSASASWQQAGTTLVRLAASAIFALTIAAELGQRTLAITAVALLYLGARSLGRGRAVQGISNAATDAAGRMMDITLPILTTWLIGHATRATLRVESILAAACFALALWGCWRVHQTGKGLLRLLLPQALVAAYFIFARQPVTAAGVALLASAQWLWSPLLQTPAGREKYIRVLQLSLAATMLLSAWTLGLGA